MFSSYLGHKGEQVIPESRPLFFVACTKTGNNETKSPKRNGRNKRNDQNDRNKCNGRKDEQNHGRDQTSESRNIEELSMSLDRPQAAQARNISIGEHRHCCITFEI